jgi:Lrp/AsnC family leucine-responsive transcriptional regulator
MPKGLRSIGTDIDAVDVRLLRMLAANSRSSLAELARAVRMSAPSVAERLRRLEEAGVIRHYTIEVDPAALGLGLAASIRIRPMAGQLLEVAALLAELPEIVECDRVTGEDCFVAKAHVRSVQDLEQCDRSDHSAGADQHVDHPVVAGGPPPPAARRSGVTAAANTLSCSDGNKKSLDFASKIGKPLTKLMCRRPLSGTSPKNMLGVSGVHPIKWTQVRPPD